MKILASALRAGGLGVLNFLISRHIELKTRDSNISPGELEERRSAMISNNVYAWLSARNSFHNYLRIPCGFAKDEIDRFVTINEKMDKIFSSNCNGNTKILKIDLGKLGNKSIITECNINCYPIIRLYKYSKTFQEIYCTYPNVDEIIASFLN